MAWKDFLKKGIAQRLQRPGVPEDGPITPSLMAMSAEDGAGQPISPVGWDVRSLTEARGVWVFFVHTAGSGATPWRGQIVLDMEYMGEGQVEGPGHVGLVAHELTHVFQRDLGNPHYWPTGGLRIAKSIRILGDSTNYMEVLAYIVGWTVEHDLLAHEVTSPDLPSHAKAQRQRRMAKLADRIATLTGPDARNAARYVLTMHPDMGIYRQNHRVEKTFPDGRIPEGGWAHWLQQIGITAQGIARIESIAAMGTLVTVSVEEADQVAGLQVD
jgi:hypothetical protein